MYATQTSRAFSDMPGRCLSIVFRIWFPLKVEKTAFSFGISNIQKKSISTASWNMMQANKTLTWYFIRSTQTKNNTKCASKRHSHKTWTLSCSHMWKIMMTKWNMKMVCGWSFYCENKRKREEWGNMRNFNWKFSHTLQPILCGFAVFPPTRKLVNG